MKNKHYVILFGIAAFALGGDCVAETKIGLGTGASFGGGGLISIPIKRNSLLIEPFITYNNRLDDVDKTSLNYDKSEYAYTQAGIGLYGLRAINKDFELYAGCVFGIGVRKSEYEYKSTFDASVQVGHQETNISENLIQPTLGIGYLINDNFSLAIETGLYYNWGKEETSKKNYQTSTAADPVIDTQKAIVDTTNSGTQTKVVFRMVF